jgi:hypothetical protein
MESSDIYSIVQLGIIGAAVTLLIVGAAISGPFLARYWYKARRAEMESSLKQSMIERGMTAEQICAVIEAGEERKQPPPPPELPPSRAENLNDWKEWANDWKSWAHRWKGRRTRV